MLKAALACITIALFSMPVFADGIDCTKATDAIDKIICASAELKSQDKTMAELYEVARVNMFGHGPSGQIAAQKDWLASRKDCDKGTASAVEQCLIDSYNSRNVELAFIAMPSMPEKAVHVLRDQKIEAAPVFEALTIFASEPDSSDWSNAKLEAKRKQILHLAAATFQLSLKEVDDSNPNGQTVKDLLDDYQLKAPDDILKTSKAFGKFIRAASWGTENATLPCGYVVTHPGLLSATESYFGATPDNQIINSNCSSIAPLTPHFTALVKQINDGWPQCEGTIRFGAFRSFAVAVDEALAPSEKLIQEFAPSKAKPKQDGSNALSGVSKSAIQLATRELASYYRNYLKAAQNKAATYATTQIAHVLDTGQQCE